MALYVGVDGVARNVKKIYVGVDGIARQVKRAYVGVDGVARLFYSTTKKIVYYGNAPDDLSAARSSMGAANVGNYVLLAGGYTGSSSSSTVDAYNSSLTRTTATNLSVARHYLVGCSIGDYALFAGGYAYTGSSSGSSSSSTVDAYNSSLTKTTVTNLSVARNDLAGCSIGDHALFAGGGTGGSATLSSVDAYNSSLTRTTATNLSVARYCLAGGSIGNYALFAGGHTGSSSSSTVDAYNGSLTRTTATNLSVARHYLVGCSIGDHVLFAGGRYGTTTSYATVDAYSGYSLTKTILTELVCAQYQSGATSIGGFALIGGGSADDSRIMTAYDEQLTRVDCPNIEGTDRFINTAASIGKYALFPGGNPSGNPFEKNVAVFTTQYE